MSGLARFVTIFTLMLLLAACGGGDAETPWDEDSSSSDDTTEATYTLGNGAGANFVSGALNISVTSLSAGGQTTVIATLADVNGNLYQGDDLDIVFSSGCVVDGMATLESPIEISGGVATTTYEATGCTGSDTIAAYTTVDNVTVTATGTVQIASAQLGSMQFVSSEPENIGLKGFGLIESADITFKVLDTNGNPVSGEIVTFSLNTTVGGITLISDKSTSDVDGLVRATVTSGTIPTSVRVTATLVSDTSISTQSDGVTISTGISDQNSFSLSLSCHSPEGWIQNGEEVTATVYAADHFNNPVPDGTAIYFTTEGGQIESECLTEEGLCSVVWTSSNPRPSNGRVTILATMLGEESFVDSVPSNGFLDWGETFYDLAEAYRDDDEDGNYTAYVDEFVDFNSDGEFTLADGMYNGLLCNSYKVDEDDDGDLDEEEELLCSEEKNVHVRSSQVLIMARRELSMDTTLDELVSTNEGVVDMTATFYGIHGDGSRQVPPGGTTISFDASIGEITSLAEATVPCSTGDSSTLEGSYSWVVKWKGTDEDETGTLTIIAETPSGFKNVYYLDLTSVAD
jgi:hypothetical protein